MSFCYSALLISTTSNIAGKNPSHFYRGLLFPQERQEVQRQVEGVETKFNLIK